MCETPCKGDANPLDEGRSTDAPKAMQVDVQSGRPREGLESRTAGTELGGPKPAERRKDITWILPCRARGDFGTGLQSRPTEAAL